jgi:putative transposase
VVFRRVLQLATLRLRSNDLKELEIVVLRHELAILRRRTRRPAMTWTDRCFLAAASRLLPRARWRSFIITSGTLLRWHRRLRRGSCPRDRLGGVVHEYVLAA